MLTFSLIDRVGPNRHLHDFQREDKSSKCVSIRDSRASVNHMVGVTVNLISAITGMQAKTYIGKTDDMSHASHE